MIPNTLYAVTDFFEILTLNVVDNIDIGHAYLVTTTLNHDKNNTDEQNVFLHKTYFEKLFFNLDFSLSKKSVFSTYEDAKSFAIKNISEKIDTYEKESIALNDRLAVLKQS